MTPMETQAPHSFGPSARALKQRRWLLLAFRLLVLAVLCLAIRQLKLASGTQALLMLGALALAWLPPGGRILAPLESRRVLLHSQALELQRGQFRRFIVFENIRHVHAVRGPRERMIALYLHTGDDTVAIRDVEGLAQIFTAISAAKPANVLIEMEDRRLDWGEPLAWMVIVAFGTIIGTILIVSM
jgi:hypothetical protein